jgi:hypothetical protein
VIEALTKKEKGWEEDDNVVIWKDRIYVPKDDKLREDIIRLHHDTSLA